MRAAEAAGRTAQAIVNGYDDTYGVYTLAAAGNQVAFTFTPAGGKPVKNPIFRIQGFTAARLPNIAAGSAPVTVNTGAADSGAFVSVDTAANELWVTLNRTVTAATAISIGAP